MLRAVHVVFFYLEIALLLGLCSLISCLQLTFGDCPVYYEEPCKPNLVKFVLSVRRPNGTSFHHLNPFKVNVPKNLDPTHSLKILIHGYGGLEIDRAINRIRDAYLDVGYSVVVVDWGPLSAIPCYATAYLNTWHVGQCIAILAVGLIPFGINPKELHLIGFSLGAHIAGFAGSNIKKALKVVPGRITGLDPALPFFATPNNEWKLDSSDAKFVDVVHTSAGSFGKIEALGDVDFYMNGGVMQPACYNAPHPPLCSHVMSGFYFAESIKNDRGFIGVRCDNIANYMLGLCQGKDVAVMGEFVNPRVRGSFYVETSNSTPFALGYIYDNLIK